MAEYPPGRKTSRWTPEVHVRAEHVSVASATWGEDREFKVINGKLNVIGHFGNAAQIFEAVEPVDGMIQVDPTKRYFVFYPPEEESDDDEDDNFDNTINNMTPVDDTGRLSDKPGSTFIDPTLLPPPPMAPAAAMPTHKEEEEEEEEEDPKAEKKAKQRAMICNEITSTEQRFVDQMNALNVLYIQPFRKNEKLVSLKNSDVLFSNINSLLSINSGLLSSLTNRENDDDFGTIFLDFGPYLKLYEDYAKYNQQALSLLSRMNNPNNSTFSKFRLHQQEMVNKPEARGLNLGALLITPIQRVPRYLLLLEEVIKNTPKRHPDMQNLKEAYKLIAEGAMAVNSSVRAPLEGFMFKRGAVVKNWKKRFFVLQDGSVRYYKDNPNKSESKQSCLGSFKTEGARVVFFSDTVYAEEGRQGKLLGITPHSDGLNIVRAYILECQNETERNNWLEGLVLHGAIDDGTIYNATMNQGVVREGELNALSTYGGFTRWGRKYVIVLSNQLHIYKTKPMTIEVQPSRIIDITPMTTVTANPGAGTFEVCQQPGEKPLTFKGSNREESKEWVAEVERLITECRNAVQQQITGIGIDIENLDMVEPSKKLGFLIKRGNTNRAWKRRYFVLDYPDLMYFKDKVEYGIRSYVPLGTIVLTKTAQVQTDEASNAFAVTPSNIPGARKYLLRGSNAKDVQAWIDSINTVIKYCEVVELREARDKNTSAVPLLTSARKFEFTPRLGSSNNLNLGTTPRASAGDIALAGTSPPANFSPGNSGTSAPVQSKSPLEIAGGSPRGSGVLPHTASAPPPRIPEKKKKKKKKPPPPPPITPKE